MSHTIHAKLDVSRVTWATARTIFSDIFIAWMQNAEQRSNMTLQRATDVNGVVGQLSRRRRRLRVETAIWQGARGALSQRDSDYSRAEIDSGPVWARRNASNCNDYGTAWWRAFSGDWCINHPPPNPPLSNVTYVIDYVPLNTQSVSPCVVRATDF